MLEVGQLIYMCMITMPFYTFAIAYITAHVCFVKDRNKALFRYKVLLAVSESEICQTGLHEICS